ncbi:unnamed protein product [Nippostrongylus brasiliensis]|uniref:Mediator of RNA polymerase II transcription subunit 19 n=1 Tax=Nippostrongylus brasiliensis TaxID=27835 RepID=A0A0N4Y4E8_NIPBR|nr:unnamed protein product [Nippostrongylus brasiliensis]
MTTRRALHFVQIPGINRKDVYGSDPGAGSLVDIRGFNLSVIQGSDRERLLNERDGPPQSAYTNPISNNVMVEPPMSMQRDAHLPAGGNRQQDAGSYMDNLLKTNKDPFDSLMKQPNAKSTNPIDSYLGQITDKPDKPKPKNTKEGTEKNKTKRNDVKSGKSGKTKHKDVNAGKSDKSKNKKTKKRDEGSAKKEPKTKHKAPETKRISPPAKDKSTQESAPNKW